MSKPACGQHTVSLLATTCAVPAPRSSHTMPHPRGSRPRTSCLTPARTSPETLTALGSRDLVIGDCFCFRNSVQCRPAWICDPFSPSLMFVRGIRRKTV
ncbi:hypothetical protein JYU34_013712 [Plutella xylostella]|uniref:Secreted protein n=1 Tax=Plutella xylostella TaxID=51655 RepID=A0ABQ7QAR8_PLUXY|nr:hypothetical protein JYU34_013712 [Plutella xylostella]